MAPVGPQEKARLLCWTSEPPFPWSLLIPVCLFCLEVHPPPVPFTPRELLCIPQNPKFWGKMLRSSWDTLSRMGLGRGKKGKVPHWKPQASPSPTPSLTFLPTPSCPGSLPGIQQFLQVPRPAWTCPGPLEDKKDGFRLPTQHPCTHTHTHTHTCTRTHYGIGGTY